MTAISPLQSVHKKGLFGDHYKKNENKILKIRELKNLSIIQMTHYKNSKTQIKDVMIDGLEVYSQSSKVSFNQDTRILWSGPNVWTIVSKKENIIKSIQKNCDLENFSITDISHSRAVIQLEGLMVKEVLKKGCPINFNKLEKNDCVSSIFQGISIVIDYTDHKLEVFNIFSLRSFGASLYHHITDAFLGYGYDGV